MAVNSKADKKHKHTIVAVVVPGKPEGKPTVTASFASAPVSKSAQMTGILPQGAKALGLRAKLVLKPDETPDSSPEQ